MKTYDHIILGPGQATGPLLGRLISTGDAIAVIEKNKVGGSCVNYGCTPTKTLVASARAIHMAKRGAEFGFKSSDVEVDFPAIRSRMNKIRNESSNGLENWMENTENVDFYPVKGEFVNDKTLQVGEEQICGEHIYINTGTRPRIPKIEGIDQVFWMDSARLLEKIELPKHLIIIGELILTFDNFDNTSAYGMEVSTNYKPNKWWSINGSFDLFSQTQRGITESLLADNNTATEEDIITESVEANNVAWNLRMNNSFKATKKLTFQLFGFYRGSNRNIQFEVDPMYFVNLGARYSFAQGKGTFSVNFNDVFNTMRFGFDGDRPFLQTGKFNWESQNLYAGISYQFGSGKNRAARRKQRDDNTKQGGGGIL